MTDKPNIIKIIYTRNIGVNTKMGYYIEQHQGLDRYGYKWDYIAYIDIETGKVVETSDYRRI